MVRSYELIVSLVNAKQELNLGVAVLIGFLLNLFITGIFAFPGFVFPTHRLLPKAYYTVRNPVLLKRVYRALGITYFRVFLMVFFWGRAKQRATFFNGTRSGIQDMVYQTKQSEFGHLAAGLSLVLASFFLLEQRLTTVLIATQVINLIGNLYPILLQRHHRMRIARIQPML